MLDVSGAFGYWYFGFLGRGKTGHMAVKLRKAATLH
jgi:hypothetical protein